MIDIPNKNGKIAVLSLSGGQDSVTSLGWALKNFEKVECMSFNYGQKHSIELQQAAIICKKYQLKHTIVDISFLDTLVDSALTSNGDVQQQHTRLKHLPASFVPNRNALFIVLIHAYAQKIGASDIILGVCQTDFSGYPDCRQVFIDSIQCSLYLASDTRVEIHTPLMYLNKAQTFELAQKVDILEDVIELSHTCYNGVREHKYDWGYGCGVCPACILRKEGYKSFIQTRDEHSL